MYRENAIELIRGCGCGARLFLYMKKDADLEKAGDVSWMEDKLKVGEKEAPVSIGVENIRLLENGVFELDLKSLILNKDPVVVRDSYGIYYVKLPRKGGTSSVLKGDGE